MLEVLDSMHTAASSQMNKDSIYPGKVSRKVNVLKIQLVTVDERNNSEVCRVAQQATHGTG